MMERGPQSNHRFVLQMTSDVLSDRHGDYDSKEDSIPDPSRKRAYPEVVGKKTSFYVYKDDKDRKDTKNDQSLADKYIESARQIFSSDGSREGDACLDWLLSRTQRIERGRSEIGNSGDYGEIIKHEEGHCQSDCELCNWDIQLPRPDSDYDSDEQFNTLLL
mmetsp:Transcript_18750/g.53937  ORF Transcript_18750/g.53937 Transcript_18750/m.53937 type:complete len:162 (+) Transcript_18750:1238-1723(+)